MAAEQRTASVHLERVLLLEVSGADLAGFDRCRELYEDFCIVTESVRHGIPVNVRVAPRHTAST